MPTAEKTIVVIEGHELAITNPDKPLWPEQGITKLAYLHKLTELSPYLLPACRDKYMTFIRFPHGAGDSSFYQKNAPQPIPPYVRTAMSGDTRHVRLDNAATLIWLGSLACLEFHASCELIGSDAPRDWIIDLDPSRDPEPRIMEAAAIVGDALASLGIASVPRTSGATGVQIYVPLQEGCSFDDLRRLGLFVGRFVTERHPGLFTLERRKHLRGSGIYFDYLQFWPGKTISAAYTPRARPLATVATPLTWDEVRRSPSPLAFNLLTIGERLSAKGDLLASAKPQSLQDVLAAIPPIS